MRKEEARLYLEHTSKEDFNLEEWQKENRYQAIQVVLKEIERLNNIIFNQNKRNSHQRIANDNLQNKNKELNNIINELEKYIKESCWKDLNNECSELNRICKQLKSQLQQKENIIKEVREYANTDKNCIPKHIKDYINNLLDKEVN